ncbi:MAG: lysophospholipid acyltransferase family protein [Alphaproteobacteria bacterium]|nr:lysophospholipid acyltransferase family protein [Alphaproteobacteria bacterium]
MLKGLKKFIKKITKSPAFTAFLGKVLYYYAWLVWKTTRWEVHGIDRFYPIWYNDKSIILTIWHGRVLMIPYFWNKKRPLNALVSPHNDGRIAASFLQKVGFGIIDGSTNDGAGAAAIALRRSLEKDEAIAIIPDGPRGPRMQMNESPLYFAKKSGKALFGATYSISHSFVAKSWDAMLIPLPFCRGIVRLTKPYYIPQNATESEIKKYQKEIEDELNELTLSSDRILGLPAIVPGVCAKSKRKKKEEK